MSSSLQQSTLQSTIHFAPAMAGGPPVHHHHWQLHQNPVFPTVVLFFVYSIRNKWVALYVNRQLEGKTGRQRKKRRSPPPPPPQSLFPQERQRVPVIPRLHLRIKDGAPRHHRSNQVLLWSGRLGLHRSLEKLFLGGHLVELVPFRNSPRCFFSPSSFFLILNQSSAWWFSFAWTDRTRNVQQRIQGERSNDGKDRGIEEGTVRQGWTGKYQVHGKRDHSSPTTWPSQCNQASRTRRLQSLLQHVSHFRLHGAWPRRTHRLTGYYFNSPTDKMLHEAVAVGARLLPYQRRSSSRHQVFQSTYWQ